MFSTHSIVRPVFLFCFVRLTIDAITIRLHLFNANYYAASHGNAWLPSLALAIRQLHVPLLVAFTIDVVIGIYSFIGTFIIIWCVSKLIHSATFCCWCSFWYFVDRCSFRRDIRDRCWSSTYIRHTTSYSFGLFELTFRTFIHSFDVIHSRVLFIHSGILHSFWYSPTIDTIRCCRYFIVLRTVPDISVIPFICCDVIRYFIQCSIHIHVLFILICSMIFHSFIICDKCCWHSILLFWCCYSFFICSWRYSFYSSFYIPCCCSLTFRCRHYWHWCFWLPMQHYSCCSMFHYHCYYFIFSALLFWVVPLPVCWLLPLYRLFWYLLNFGLQYYFPFPTFYWCHWYICYLFAFHYGDHLLFCYSACYSIPVSTYYHSCNYYIISNCCLLIVISLLLHFYIIIWYWYYSDDIISVIRVTTAGLGHGPAHGGWPGWEGGRRRAVRSVSPG